MGRDKSTIAAERTILSTKEIVRDKKKAQDPETMSKVSDHSKSKKSASKQSKRRMGDLNSQINGDPGLETEEAEYCIAYDQSNYHDALKRLDEKKKKNHSYTAQRSGEITIEREGSKMLVNGQQVDVSGPDSRRIRKQIAGMTEEMALDNKKKLLILKLMKKSPLAHMVRDLEINDDPIKRGSTRSLSSTSIRICPWHRSR